MLRSWKLQWLINEFITFPNYKKHFIELNSSWRYWWLLLTKLVNKVNPAPALLSLKKGGKFYVHDFMTLYIYTEIFVDKCYELGMKLEEDGTIIDVGGNIGLFTLWMKQQYPDMTVYSFEPFKQNYDQLVSNLLLSKVKHVNPIMRGVGGHTRIEKLYLNPKNLGGHSIYKQDDNNESVDIDIVSLDEVLAALGPKTCSLLKLDCEGAEYEIIKSMTAETAKKIKRIIFEPSEKLYNPAELISHLVKIGYTMKRSTDNYIAAYED
ncbi:FkbM family methyltransferase [Hufsiella ginkgonis]|uniref:FkbM family methyltransferase n=1 Tax=Hufsiella ginkgonis TaxID=2695274 RepID=A0A7K1XZA8_9SPHI|nr:FkbM family methyltransferase [Hufsiella ginkgonis]MXV16345.1 FkbM family methyltransferase [Hufsiella ginkgonis]